MIVYVSYKLHGYEVGLKALINRDDLIFTLEDELYAFRAIIIHAIKNQCSYQVNVSNTRIEIEGGHRIR